jgi:hypothetical protein
MSWICGGKNIPLKNLVSRSLQQSRAALRDKVGCAKRSSERAGSGLWLVSWEHVRPLAGNWNFGHIAEFSLSVVDWSCIGLILTTCTTTRANSSEPPTSIRPFNNPLTFLSPSFITFFCSSSYIRPDIGVLCSHWCSWILQKILYFGMLNGEALKLLFNRWLVWMPAGTNTLNCSKFHRYR